jgi:hypothetical protein
MSKRPSIDLMALTSEQAAPMAEATQRMPVSITTKNTAKSSARPMAVRTENLEALAFKVPPVFRKRFKQRAVTADLKLNELLFEALEAWEKMNGIKK